MFIVYILIVINITLLICYIMLLPKVEHYANSPLLVWNTEVNMEMIHIRVDELDHSSKLQSTLANIKNVTYASDNGTDDDEALLTDALTYSTHFQSKKLVTILPDEKVMVIMKPKDRFNNEPFTEIQGKTIGYFDDSSKTLLQCIAISHGIDIQRLKLKRCNMPPREQHICHCVIYILI